MAPGRLAILVAGVVMGLGLGAIPGLGGLVGLSILLPFTFHMDAYTAVALMVGLAAVTTVSDSIPAVLFGVPGTVAAQATILDGHAMAKKGEVGRAFGAVYFAAMLGGVFGAIVLALAIPIMRSVVLAFGAPEFFMLGLLGISMVAVLSGRAPLRGVVAAGLGLLFSMVGASSQTGVLRWTFGQVYLWKGIPLVPMVLGIFALPEMVDLAIRGTHIADVPSDAIRGRNQGFRDVLRNWFLVLRCSLIGVGAGAIPGLGSAVVDWLAYGHARQTCRGAAETFGKGDVRGVIGPESAANAKEGGALIPTIAFGVPTSGSMALLLAAFLIQGLTPGPDMLTKHLAVTYTILWSLTLAHLIGSGIVLLFTGQLARLARVRIHLLVPVVVTVVFLASFQATRSLGDLVSLLVFGLLGWFMKRTGWARPPLVLGFLLGPVIENNLFISINAYPGNVWLLRPLVLVLAAVTFATLAYSLRQQYRATAPVRAPGASEGSLDA